MLYLNIRHTLPRIGIDMRPSTLDSRIVQPRAESEIRQAESHMGVKQPTNTMNSYPSRRAYGARTVDDLTREKGQEGYSDVRQATSSHTRKAWSMIDNGAKKGRNEIKSQAKGELSAEISRQRYMEVQAVPDPEVSVTPVQATGDIDTGSWDYRINTAEKADVTFNRGDIRIYLEQAGSIHRWVTEGRYDIYA